MNDIQWLSYAKWECKFHIVWIPTTGLMRFASLTASYVGLVTLASALSASGPGVVSPLP